MSDGLSEAEAKLRKLAERLHQGWAKKHPVTEQELSIAHQIVKEHCQEEQKNREATEKAKEEASRRHEAEEKLSQEQRHAEQEKKQREEQSRRHGHGH